MPEKILVYPYHRDRIGEEDFITDRKFDSHLVAGPFETLTREIIDSARRKAQEIRDNTPQHFGGTESISFRNSLDIKERRPKLLNRIQLPGWRVVGQVTLRDGEPQEKLLEYYLH